MQNYDDMLDNAIEKLPKISIDKKRFEIPRVRGKFEGNKTIITNINNIVSILHRPINMLVKFISKALAVPIDYDGSRLILKAKILPQRINEKILDFAKQYVICAKCGKPDTEIIEENGQYFIRCMACGEKEIAKNPDMIKEA